MKAIQLRSPYHLFYTKPDLASVNLEIFKGDSFDNIPTSIYNIVSRAVNEKVSLEISEILRSEIQTNILQNKDSAKWFILQASFFDEEDNLIGYDNQYFVARDGYLQRSDNPQIYNNQLSQDFRDWDAAGINVGSGEDDFFNTDKAFSIENTLAEGNISFAVPTGSYSIGVFVKSNNQSAEVIKLNDVAFDIANESVTVTQKDFDIRKLTGNWYFIQVYERNINKVELKLDQVLGSSFLVCFPSVVKFQRLRLKPEDLLLKSNKELMLPTGESYTLTVDQCLSSFYRVSNVGGVGVSPFVNISDGNQIQNVNFTANLLSFEYTDIDNLAKDLNVKFNRICEPKYKPSKVSFINAYGVVEDVWMFKVKRETLKTSKESYKRKTIIDGENQSVLGQESVYIKTSEKEVVLTSGFYPESFNETFEQVFNSLFVWIDGEPVTVEDSDFQIKTKVNEKLIDYVITFKYANPEMNNLR